MAQPTPPEFKPTTHKKTAPHAHKSKTGQPLPPIENQTIVAYENNPFTIAASGIDGLFKYAKVLAIIMLVLSLFGIFGNAIPAAFDHGSYQPEPTPTPAEPVASPSLSPEQVIALVAVVGGIAFVAIAIGFLVSAIFTGLRDVSAAAVTNQKPVSFGEACTVLFSRFGGYLWLQVLIVVKVFLWSLLLVVPGVIMAVRYSLAGTAFFAQNMKASDALAHSTRITKGGWFTTVASYGLFNLITLGLISVLIDTGVRGILLRQFTAYDAAGVRKPSPHGLTIAYFAFLIFVVLAGLGMLVALAAFAISGFSE